MIQTKNLGTNICNEISKNVPIPNQFSPEDSFSPSLGKTEELDQPNVVQTYVSSYDV